MTSLEDKRSLTRSKAKKLTRQQLLEWLEWNDRNGCYSDEECRLEGFKPWTRAEALEMVLDWLNKEAPGERVVTGKLSFNKRNNGKSAKSNPARLRALTKI